MPPRPTPALTFVSSPGTGAPPATLGPYTMLPFSPDPQPLNTEVSKVAPPKAPAGEHVSFTPALLHLQVASWNSYQGQGVSWTDGYTGDAYATATLSELQNVQGGPTSMVFTLPGNTFAFYFYGVLRNLPFQAPPCPSLDMTATAQAVSPLKTGKGTVKTWTVSVSECSAHYFGFYCSGGLILTSIKVGSVIDFAVGEFGIYV